MSASAKLLVIPLSCSDSANNVLLERFRCPERYLDLASAGVFSPESGYFRFGAGTICYGQAAICTPTPAAVGDLFDVSRYAVRCGGNLTLPFQPEQIVDNLRYERYVPTGSPHLSEILRTLYYRLRPALGVPVRKHLQKAALKFRPHASFPSWPLDTTVDDLLERLLVLSLEGRTGRRIPFIWFWPDGASACGMVTHDVETRKGVELTPRLMDLDDEFGIKASFQVIPEKQYQVREKYLRLIRDRGFDLNVQDLTHDGNLFRDREEFVRRARSINRYLHAWDTRGFRAGRMYRNVDWYDMLDISFDMSVPTVAELEPQPGGCCTVFPYFVRDVLELPLTTTQDYSLLHIRGDYSTQLWDTQLKLILAKNGLASFIIHPDYILENHALPIYRKFLAQLAEVQHTQNLWIAQAKEVDRWWRERSQMRLVRRGERWIIEGPGRERARVAYAFLVDGELRYAVERWP